VRGEKGDRRRNGADADAGGLDELIAFDATRGGGIEDFARFPFERLPWTDLEEEGASRDGFLCVKASRSRRVYRFELGAVGRAPAERVVFAKRYLINTWRRRWANRTIGSKARREFELGRRAIERGIATPTPLAWREDRDEASYLLTELWPNRGSLAESIAREPAAAGRLPALAAETLAAAHAAGFYHDDCSAHHLLLGEGDRLAFIDLDNGKLSRRPVSDGRRRLNLFQCLRSMEWTTVPTSARDAFLAEYLDRAGIEPGSKPGSPRWRIWRDGIERRARQKVGRSVFEVD
jgi:tRNA A-37 threonylcarbamoyl transferase component Bud32